MNVQVITLTVPEMCCRHDVRRISARVADLPGVTSIRVDRANRTIVVKGEVTPDAVRAAVVAAGYDVT